MGTIVKVTKTSNFGRCSGGNRAQRSFDGASEKNEPHMKAPRVMPLEGVSTYALRGIRVRGVENPQGFGIDERRFVVWANRI